MAFNHTPSVTYTTTIPDTFTDDDDGTVYLAGYDYDINDPREDWDSTECELYVFRSAVMTFNDRATEPEHPAIRAFLHYIVYDDGTDEEALTKARRYMAAFYPEWRGILELTPGHGYGCGDWHDAVTVISSDGDWTPTTENARAIANEYSNWRYGNVFWVSREDKDEDDRLYGIIADSMEDAVTLFKDLGY